MMDAVDFIAKLRTSFPVKHDDAGVEKQWTLALVGALRGFSSSVLERAAQNIIDTRDDRRFPLPAECRRACQDADKVLRAEIGRVALPSMQDPTKRKEEASEETVWNVLMVTDLAKKAAKEGWIGMLVPYCYKHGRLPDDAGVIAEMRRAAKEIENWHGSGAVANTKAIIMQRRQDLTDRVLGGQR